MKLINRWSLAGLVTKLKVVQAYKFQLRDSKQLSVELKTHFADYEAYQKWNFELGQALSEQTDLAKQFQLDIVQYMQFLMLYHRSGSTIPDVQYDALITQLKPTKMTIMQLINALKLAASQPKLQTISKSDLIEYCSATSHSTFPTLFHYCLHLVARQRFFSLEEATQILQAIKHFELYPLKWVRALVRLCLDSLDESSDVKNLALISNAIANAPDKYLLRLCQHVNFAKAPTIQELVVILWSVTHIRKKDDTVFISAMEAILAHMQLVVGCNNQTDKVLALWSLHKVQLECKYLAENIRPLTAQLQSSSHQQLSTSSSQENLSQYYVASVKLDLLDETQASQTFKRILQVSDFKSQMFSLVMYHTCQLFPHFIVENRSLIAPHLPDIVNETNIANFFSVYKDQPTITSALFTHALRLAPKLSVAGIKIIAELLTQQRREFLTASFAALLNKTQHINEARSHLLGHESQIAALLLQHRRELGTLEHAGTFIVNLIELLVSHPPSRLAGVGNIIYVGSTFINANTLQAGFAAFESRCSELDLLELVNFYRAAFNLGVASAEFIERVDELIVVKLGPRGGRDAFQERFVASYKQHYQPEFGRLRRVNAQL